MILNKPNFPPFLLVFHESFAFYYYYYFFYLMKNSGGGGDDLIDHPSQAKKRGVYNPIPPRIYACDWEHLVIMI